MKRTDRQTGLPARLTRRKAFTLVELLVVIAIIGILFVVLISKVDFATEKAKAAGVQTDFRSYQLAIETVARENAGLSTLVDDDASGAEKYAALEAALNKNLDPKLRVEIDENGDITTDAKDPWKEQYLGEYLAPDADGTVKDRGAIVMYCKGSNLKLGSTSETINGVVNVTIESGKEAEGADDYSISTVYTYISGYGEIKTTTDGFSNDVSDNAGQDNNTPANPADPNNPGGPTDDSGNVDLSQIAAGLYEAGSNYTVMTKSWQELLNENIIFVEDGEIRANPAVGGEDVYVLCGDLVLPNDGSIETLADCAFPGCVYLTGISIPESVYSIGVQAFCACDLESIVIPDGVTSIGKQTFYECKNLTSVTIPANVTSIGSEAFFDCTNLNSITFKGTVEQWNAIEKGAGWEGYVDIYEYSAIPANYVQCSNGQSLIYSNGLAFNLVNDGTCSIYGMVRNNSIKEVVIPDEIEGYVVTKINDCAFSGAKITSITIPASVTYIGTEAFYVFSGSTLENITFKGTVEQWNSITFGDYWNYEVPATYVQCSDGQVSLVATSEGLNFTLKDDGTYEVSDIGDCTDTDIVIPATYNGKPVTSIGATSLWFNYDLTSITIPNSVTSIGESAFQECTNLKSVTMSANITTIGNSAFMDCWCLDGVIIPNGITSIGQGVFSYCALTSVTIPDGVVSIGNSAFSGCSKLTSVTIPDGVVSIGNSAFSGCDFTNITIPDSVTSIGDYAFSGCSKLTSVTIPNGTTAINRMFQGCTALTSITIPDSVTSIGDYAFSDCKNLTSITIPDGVTNIGSRAFKNCENLASINIPDSVTSIGNYAFFKCDSLTNITILGSDASLGQYAFSSCVGLTSVTIGDGITSIGKYAFTGCSSLTSVTISDSVTNIIAYAFEGCAGLTNIVFEGTIEQWNAITKNYGWNGYQEPAPATKVICSDGEVALQ